MHLINPKEYKITALRECPVPEEMLLCDTPEKVVEYWNLHVKTGPYYNPDCECIVALFLTTRRRVKGHQLISIGTRDTILVEVTSVFRGALIAAAAAIILVHNHPSNDAEPSSADIKVTRELARAAEILKIQLLDHIIIGSGARPFRSLRALGVF